MIAAFFGAIKIGAVPVPLNTRWTAAEYEYVLRDSSARVVILSGTLHGRSQQGHRRLLSRCAMSSSRATRRGRGAGRSDSRRSPPTASPELEAEPTSRDAPAFWLYSSGTTGQPEGLRSSAARHGRVRRRLRARRARHRRARRCFSVAKLFFAYGLGNSMYFPFAVGATSILWPGAGHAAGRLRHHRALPADAVLLGADPLRDDAGPSRRRSARIRSVEHPARRVGRRGAAAGAVPPVSGSLRRSRSSTASARPRVLHIFISNQPGRVRPGSSGVPVPGYEARLVDENGRPVRRGELGDLIVQRRLDVCALLESARADEGHDRRALDPDRRQVPAGRGRLLLVRRTLRRHAEGRRHLGQSGGSRTPPARASRGRGVRGHRARGSRWPRQAGRPRRPAQRRHGRRASSAHELQQFARQRLAEYKRPRWIEFVDALPVTATGKIQRFKLRNSSSVASGFSRKDV